ncbi:MAG TPA: GNAT family N-acetyltransferase [Polyangiaceae bacterium]|nr:GNAT family N-acetyltransferase [Polyangiaceae bacterium]
MTTSCSDPLSTPPPVHASATDTTLARVLRDFDATRLELLPLAAEHASKYFELTRNSSLAELARLRYFDSVRSVEAWIAATQCSTTSSLELDQRYAVVHQDLGLVGGVSLSGTQHEAFCSFWIGAPYQARGMGTSSVQLVTALARELGLEQLFAVVYPDNLRSQRLLRSAHWQQLSVPCNPPTPLDFYACSLLPQELPIAQAPKVSALLALLQRVNPALSPRLTPSPLQGAADTISTQGA